MKRKSTSARRDGRGGWPPNPLANLLTPEQVAERLGLSVDTVRQYAREPHAKLAAVRILGRLAFEPAEIERFDRERRTVGRPKAE